MKDKKYKLKRHVLGVGFTRYRLNDDWSAAEHIRLYSDSSRENPVFLKMQNWDNKARLVLEEVASGDAPETAAIMLRSQLKKAITRFEIILGRVRGCDHPAKHGVSEIEIPGWIQEIKGVLRAARNA